MFEMNKKNHNFITAPHSPEGARLIDHSATIIGYGDEGKIVAMDGWHAHIMDTYDAFGVEMPEGVYAPVADRLWVKVDAETTLVPGNSRPDVRPEAIKRSISAFGFETRLPMARIFQLNPEIVRELKKFPKVKVLLVEANGMFLSRGLITEDIEIAAQSYILVQAYHLYAAVSEMVGQIRVEFNRGPDGNVDLIKPIRLADDGSRRAIIASAVRVR